MFQSTLDDVFSESLKSTDCVAILYNCLKNVEKQVKEIYQISETTKESQIKGELQLVEMVESVKYINEKFDEDEKERKEK